jgi:23S rRNA pseudouridine2605 synthase
MVREGRIRLNGAVRRDPETPVTPGRDRIVADGENVEAQKNVYLMMNKPRGLVTTAADEKGRETVYSILAEGERLPWVAPIGRLDKASEGLLLFSNDSEWGARIAAPETHLDKSYHVQIDTRAGDSLVDALERGVKLDDGELLRAKQVRLLRSGGKNCWLEIQLDEGRNRHIRRMLEALGIRVLRLVRVAIGPLALGPLAKGTFRALTIREKQRLDDAIGKKL